MGMLRFLLGRRAKYIFLVIAFAVGPITVPFSARADCSPDDLWNALENTFSTLTSSGCAGVTSDPALWAPVGVASGIMAGVSQSQQFCQDVQNVQNQLTNVQGDGSSLVSALNNAGVDASFLSSALSALGSASDALSVVLCSCALANNISQLGGDVGDCIQGALCDLQNLANDIDPSGFPACTGKVVNVPTDCTQNPCDPKTGVCNPNLVTLNQCPSGDDTPPVNQVNGPNGNGTIVSVTNGADQSGNIYVQQCICPPPMVGKWIPFGNYSGWAGVVIDPNCQFFMCECPDGSTAAGPTGAAQYLCICDNTHQPVQPPVKTTTNPEGVPCPVPLTGVPCPRGQTNVGGKCVAACPKNEVLLANGTCCDPAQASACGTCCPNGQTPDPATGSCAAALPIPRPGAPQKLR